MSALQPARTESPTRLTPPPSSTTSDSSDGREKSSHARSRPALDGDGVSHYELFSREPPPLDYTITANSRERKIAIWITLLYAEAGVLPLLLFFSLRWGAHVSTTTNLAIITSLIGAVSGTKVSMRQWYLWLGTGHHTRRPIGAGRWGMDIFQVVLSLCMASFFIPLIIGSSVNPANPRIVALSLPCTMIVLSLPLLLTGLFPHKLKVPFRVSSLPTLEPLPPFAYFFVEDVVAVDGGGCTQFRQAWRVRYEESRTMRAHIRGVSLLFGISGTAIAVALLATAWVAPLDTAYGLCWSVPWLWVMVTGFATIAWTHDMLKREKENWRIEHIEDPLPFRAGKYDPPVVPPDRVATFEADLEARRRASAPGPRPLETVPSSDEDTPHQRNMSVP